MNYRWFYPFLVIVLFIFFDEDFIFLKIVINLLQKIDGKLEEEETKGNKTL